MTGQRGGKVCINLMDYLPTSPPVGKSAPKPQPKETLSQFKARYSL